MIDELKILLALNGNQRLPHLEAEIFADEALVLQYLLHLYGYAGNYSNYSCTYSLPFLCYYYASHIMQDRWPVAEQIIKSSGMYNSAYRRFIEQHCINLS